MRWVDKVKNEEVLNLVIEKRSSYAIRCTNKFPPFLIKNWAFIVKERNLVFYSKYCPSLSTTFSHLSNLDPIIRRNKKSSRVNFDTYPNLNQPNIFCRFANI